MTQAIKLLNHGSVALIETVGSDLSIVRAARTSYAALMATALDTLN